MSISASNNPGGGSITVACQIAPQPISGRVYFELNINGFAYELFNNSITIGTQPSTTYSISGTAYYNTSVGTTAIATATTSIKTNKADSGTGSNPGCPKHASLVTYPGDTSTVANRSGWVYIQYDWLALGTPQTSGSVQIRYRTAATATWSYGQVFHYNLGVTNRNHFFIINLIPGQSYQVQLGSDCGSGVVPVEADFDGNPISTVTAGPE